MISLFCQKYTTYSLFRGGPHHLVPYQFPPSPSTPSPLLPPSQPVHMENEQILPIEISNFFSRNRKTRWKTMHEGVDERMHDDLTSMRQYGMLWLIHERAQRCSCREGRYTLYDPHNWLQWVEYYTGPLRRLIKFILLKANTHTQKKDPQKKKIHQYAIIIVRLYFINIFEFESKKKNVWKFHIRLFQFRN